MFRTIAIVLAVALATTTAHAALQGRLPATPGGTDYRAYYDDVLHILWVADANLAQTSNFDSDGLMAWSDAQTWIAKLNSGSYLGLSNWRLPSADVNADNSIIECSTSTELNCRDNEMGYMYWRNLVTASLPAPFANLLPGYWSGTEYAPLAGYALYFDFTSGGQGHALETSFEHGWAVRNGDIDSDRDGVQDFEDNCTLVANADQRDTNGDGYGNMCDPDFDNNGIVNINDFNRLKARLGVFPVVDVDTDLDGNGVVNINDLNRLKSYLGKPPGPAIFPLRYLLTVAVNGSGAGTVSSAPAGIICGALGADCSEIYNNNTVVTLTATPVASSRFSGWGGACAGTGACVITMDAAKSVSANFTLTYPLTVAIGGTGSGTVSSSPAGINCGADCSENYDYNTVVNLFATPQVGSSFTFWSGSCNGGACMLTMDGGKSATANFTLLDTNPACSSNQFLGSISGDTGSGVLGTTGVGEKWLRVHLTEDDTTLLLAVYLSGRITLTSPANSDYDLYVYCLSCGGTLAGSSTSGTSSDVVDVRRNDVLGTVDSFDVLIEVRYFSGSTTSAWSLSVTGNTTVSAPTCQ